MEDLNYQDRLEIYRQSKTAKPNLLRLFTNKENKANSDKLNYEISKIPVEIKEPSIKNKEPKQELINVNQLNKSTFKMGFYRLNELHKDLHDLSRKQRDLYQQTISLKLELNDLHKDETVKALGLCLKIEDYFDEIDTIQKVLKHYADHKVVLLQTPEDFSHLTPGQVLQRRNNKRANRSKILKKIYTLQLQLNKGVVLSVKTKIEVKLEKYNAKVLLLDSDIISLDKLVNER